jgi:hypothetical protein
MTAICSFDLDLLTGCAATVPPLEGVLGATTSRETDCSSTAVVDISYQ